MSETPFRVDRLGQRPMVRVNDRPFETFEENIRAHERADDLNDAWSAAGGPALARQRDELVRLAQNLIDTLNAHEVDSLDCDRSGVAHCDCLTRAIDRLAAAIGGGA